MRPASTGAAPAMEEGKEQQQMELSSLGQASSSLSRSGGPFGGTDGGSGSSAVEADVESGARSGGGGGVGDLGGEESSEYDSDEDSEDDAPFTYKELQARTQAARAAVNILLPNRTDDMAEREGPYGTRRRWRGEGQRCVPLCVCVCVCDCRVG